VKGIVRLKRRNWLAIAAAGILAAVCSGSAQAEDYDVDRIGYHNRGAYVGCLDIEWKTPSGGEHYASDAGHCIAAGKTTYWRLENLAKQDSSLVAGSEVWAVITIPLGSGHGCHKKLTKFYYQPDSSTTVTYVTRGTTLSGNTCHVQKIGDARYRGSQADAPGVDRGDTQ